MKFMPDPVSPFSVASAILDPPHLTAEGKSSEIENHSSLAFLLQTLSFQSQGTGQ